MLEKNFRAEIKNGCLRNAYFFFGDEEYLKRIARRTLKSAVIDDDGFDSFNHAVFSAAVTSPAELREPLSAFPFMSEKKLVEYVDADLSIFSGNKLAELKELLSNEALFESSILCIVSSYDGFQFPKKAAEKKFFELLDVELAPVLTTVYFNAPAPAELAKWVVRHLEHNGVRCSVELAKAIIARGGKSMDRLALETDKLACYVLSHGRCDVAPEDLDTVSEADPELAAFAISNAILSHRTVDALNALEAAKAEKEKPVSVLASITSSYSDMLVAKELAATGISDREISAKTNLIEYKVKLCRNASAGVSRAMLERALELCIECDGLLKSGTSGFAPIERLLCELSLLRRNDR